MTKSTRIDGLKTVSCIFVLFIQAYRRGGGSDLTYFLSNIIADCAVPGFALISSYLLYCKGEFNCLKNIRKKAKSLLIPYFIFITLWIVLDFIKIYAFHMSGEADYAEYGFLDWMDAYLGLYASTSWKPALTVLWYIRDLFICNVIAIPLKELIDRFPRIIFLLTLFAWISGVASYVIHTYVLVFFIFGYYLVKYQIGFDFLDRRIKLSVATLLYVLFALIDFAVDITPIHRIFIIVSLLYFVVVSKKFDLKSTQHWIHIIAPTTFWIYLIHKFVYAVMDAFLAPAQYYLALAVYFIKPVLAFGIGIGSYYFLRAVFPRLLQFVLGGRVIKQEKLHN